MKRFRMSEWLLITILLVVFVALTAPMQLPVLLFKSAQVTLSGWIGYWFDRGIAPYNRPANTELSDMERAAASVRRAIIVGAAMLAGALGA